MQPPSRQTAGMCCAQTNSATSLSVPSLRQAHSQQRTSLKQVSIWGDTACHLSLVTALLPASAYMCFCRYCDTSYNAAGDEAVDEPHLLLGHFSSIVTSLTMSPDNRWLVSTDRERKVRVSVFPQQPLLVSFIPCSHATIAHQSVSLTASPDSFVSQGAFCIQSFCLGHTALVTCSAFVTEAGSLLLVTGSGDGTLRYLYDTSL